ncbi:MAG: hypothetical protein QOF70_2654 [Acetobacteraceae bacterium]|jgi:hypothetical protein|nr:hypothetical protein [Acetobacteraceae bacterium]
MCDICQSLVQIGFHPGQVADVLLGRALDDPLIDELSRRIFHRCEVAARDVGVNPGVLFEREGDRNGIQDYHGNRVVKNRILAGLCQSVAVCPAVSFFAGGKPEWDDRVIPDAVGPVG